MKQSTLTSLAILKVNFDDAGHDYADNFLPFVVEAIRTTEHDEISISALQRDIRESFGLVVPQGALNTLLRRAERKNLVKRAHGVFCRVPGAGNSEFAKERADALRQQSALIAKLVSFVQEKLGLVWDPEEAEEAMLRHLQQSCVPILAATTEGCPIPPLPPSAPATEFAVNAFTVHLFETDPPGFAVLEAVAKGNMLATALFLPEIANANKKFKSLTVYLDTTLLLRALGLEGEGLREPAVELLTLLYEMNVDLACFDATRDELRGILDAARHALQDRSRIKRGLFSVYENFISSGLRASDVELIIARLERSLKALHVNVKERPLHQVSLTLDEAKLTQILTDLMPAQNAVAQRHDIDCITAIHRLRRGQPKSDVETCGHVFVTSNNALAMAAARYFIDEHERLVVPLCINDHTMATLAWVKNPTLANNWTRKRLIADSYAALRPSNDLWRKYAKEVARLQEAKEISDEEYDVLRFSMVARNALMDSTLGRPDAFTEGTVREVLEVAKKHIRKETEEALATEQERRAGAEAKTREMAEELEQIRLQSEGRIRGIARVCGIAARWISYIGAALVGIYGFSLTLPPDMLPFGPIGIWITRGAIFLFSGLAIWSLLEGGSVRTLSRAIEVRTSVWVERKLSGIFGID